MKRVVVVVCVVVLLAAVAVLVLRPGSRGGASPGQPGGLADALGGLLPTASVTADDVAGTPCWDAEGRLTVDSGASCLTRLPEGRTRLALCREAGPVAVVVRVRGQRFGSQRTTPGACADLPGDPVRLYDEGSVLQVTCPFPGEACVLRLRS